MRRRATKKNKRSRLKLQNRRLTSERLEDRRLLSLNANIGDIFLKSTEWSDEFETQLVGGGYSIEEANPNSAPWVNLDQIEVHFESEANVSSASLVLQAAASGLVPVSVREFEYDAETFVARWTFDAPLSSESYSVRITCGDLIDAASFGLSEPRFEFSVVAGDSDATGRTDVLDGLGLRERMFTQLSAPNYSAAYDLNGSGRIDILDGLWFREHMFDTLPEADLDLAGPDLAASLLNDTAAFGATNSDGVTFDARMAGSVSDSLGVVWLGYQVNGGAFEEVLVAQDGSFAIDPSGLPDGEHIVEIVAFDSFLNRTSQEVEFTLDTVGPTVPTVQLDFASDTGVIGDNATSEARVKLIGQSDSGSLLEISPGQRTALTNAAGDYAIAAVPLTLGANELNLSAYDTAGNSVTIGTTIVRDALGTDIALADNSSFVQEHRQLIDVGPADGARLLRFDLDAVFDTTDSASLLEDLFSVYLVDPANPSDTVLDRGVSGTSLFSLSGDQTEYAIGLARFDGTSVEIDVSSVESLAQAELVFQLLNHDFDTGTQVAIRNLEVVIDDTRQPSRLLFGAEEVDRPGLEADLTGYVAASDIVLEAGNVRFDATTGEYVVEARLKNAGQSTGRQIVVLLPGLPNGVQLVNASGFDGLGTPYVNFSDAIASGGLGRNEISQSIELRFSNPSDLLFPIRPEVLTGGENRSPVLQPIGSLEVSPGGALSVPILASDVDGDRLTFAIRSEGLLPNVSLLSDRLVVQPSPDQLGQYEFTVIASDGSKTVEQPVSLDVVADPEGTTRLTGRVLDTNEMPIAGIVIQLGRFQTTTNLDGSFTLALPSFVAPTESFDIEVPQGDLYFDPLATGSRTIDLNRAGFDVTTGGSLQNPRQHQNLITAFLDGSVVYGSDATRAAALRTMNGDGKLSVSAGDLLPLNNNSFFAEAPLENENSGQHDPGELFVAGDVRANDNVQLLALQTLLVREHNRKADELALADPGLSGEAIYQTARRWVGALLQHITYNEFLPVLLGEGALSAYSGYDANTDPQISGVFSGAAFRIGHSMASDEVLRLDESGASLAGGSLTLREAFFNPDPINADGIEPYLQGMSLQQAQEVDAKLIDALRNFLFGAPGAGGLDLISMNIQRGRDLGLPSYNQTRIDFGLTPAANFSDISSSLAVQAELATVYSDVNDVDLIVGGLAEDHVAGALVGEVFHAILLDQFTRTRDGDRFWYENEQFTAAELDAIRDTSLSSLIIQNSSISTLPDSVFVTGDAPAGSSPVGSAVSGAAVENRSIDGTGNNIASPGLGSTNENLLVNYTLGYEDGISEPAGADRPNARDISNAVFAQDASLPNARGATTMFMIWGQLLAHDIALTPGGTDNTLRVHGESFAGPEVYPFVAEKLPLLFGHEIYPGVENVLDRPIYLPALDVAGGTTINPATDTMVSQEIAPGETVEVLVEAGTLQSRDGTMFDGVLSITEVPRELTPAALPYEFVPDTVVTIQPAEMVFDQPASISFPNRGSLPAGTQMDLWSIDPTTGEFEDVGDMIVTPDGLRIVTTSGGIRNSSWHFPAPLREELLDDSEDDRNLNQECPECVATAAATSEVELHSGSLIETHSLPAFTSLGVPQTLTFTYDSLRADPRPIVHFGFTNLSPRSGDFRRVEASLSAKGAGATFTIAPNQFWRLPREGGPIHFGIQGDLSTSPSGRYSMQVNLDIFSRGAATQRGIFTSEVLHVNSISSPVGAGWGIAGIQHLVENPDGSVILIDGDGSELLFEPGMSADMPFISPPGDFSQFIKASDGTYTRIMKDRTTFNFNIEKLLDTIEDRNGNVRRFVYDDNRLLQTIVYPDNQRVEFDYVDGLLASVSDPAGRTTTFEHDSAGNLSRISDPSQATRTFSYDAKHHLTEEVTPRGFLEQIDYDFAGRVTGVVTADGSRLNYSPLQTQMLYGPTVRDIVDRPAFLRGDAVAFYSTAQGDVVSTALDKAGQSVSSSDLLGNGNSIERDDANLITSRRDSKGFETQFRYDEMGNLIEIIDNLDSANGISIDSPIVSSKSTETPDLRIFDINSDGALDVITVDGFDQSLSIFHGVGDGTFTAHANIELPGESYSLELADINEDGRIDILALGELEETDTSGFLLVALQQADGSFVPTHVLQELFYDAFAIADFDEDGHLDYVATAGSGFVDIFYGLGDGTFVEGESVTVPGAAGDLAVGRFNRDSRPDFATVATSGSVSIVFNEGSGAFSTQTIAVGQVPLAIATADSAGDGFVDTIAAANFLDGTVSLLIADADGNFTSPATDIPFGSQPLGVELADLNGDGVLDLIVAHRGSQDVWVRLGRGAAIFDEPIQIDVGQQLNAIEAGDLNGDGILDILTAAQFLPGRLYALLVNTNNAVTSTASQSFEYDETFNQVVSYTDELDRITNYVVDEFTGDLLSVVRPNNDRDTFSYFATGQLKQATDALGRETRYEYDSLGRAVAIHLAYGTTLQATQRFEYDDAGNQTAIIDENNNRTEFEYDELNRLTLTRDPVGDTSRFEYDDAGNLVKTTDALGNVTRNRYDERNRLIATIDADGGSTTFDYDKEGNLTLVVDPLGNVTQNFYDARNRLKRTIDPEGGRTSFGYDRNGNLTTLNDPVGNSTTFVYDARDRLVREIDPLGNATDYAYDAADNLISKTDRNGRVTQFDYDDLDRLETETWVGGGNVIDYAYDPVGNLLSVSDAFSSLTFTYDSRDRVKTVDNLGTPGAPNVVLTYGYDAVGNVTSVTDVIDGAAGATTDYAYDALNRTTSIEQSGPTVSQKAVDFLYNELGQFERISRYSDLARENLVARTDYAYDELNRLTDLDHANALDEVLAFYDYEYDSASRITQITDIDGVTDYSYDDRSQLTGADRADGDLRGDESYNYDANGNRTDSHLHGSGYVTGDGNRLLSDGTYNYQYDDEGNMTRRTEIASGDYRVFEWDYRNRLVQVTDFSSGGIITQEVDFAYDALGRRVLKSVDVDGLGPIGSNTLIFVYDRDNVLLDYQDPDGIIEPEYPVLLQRYLHGPGVDQVLSQETLPDNASWHITNSLGSVVGLVDSDGLLVEMYRYDSFGSLIDKTATQSRFLYTGRELDAEIDLYFYRARYYSAAGGRFISEDPIRYLAADSLLYRYVSNSPTHFIDPYGLQATDVHRNTVVADGQGGIRPQIAPGQDALCLPCIYAHEQSHIEALLKHDPRVGYDNKTGDPLPDGTIIKPPNRTFRDREERRAIGVETRCLERLLDTGITADEKNRIRERIRQLRRYRQGFTSPHFEEF